MKSNNCRLLLLLALVFPAGSFAQEKESNDQQKDVFSASANYQSALHYFGRTDSLKSSGLFPIVGFQSKTGLYAQGSFIFVQNASLALQYTGSTIEAGYRFPQSTHFSGNLFYTRFLYKEQSTLVQSALKGQTGVNLSWLNKVVNINGGVDLKFSNRTDLGATLGLDHLFIFANPDKHSAFAIDPAIYAYAGTQNFSTTYLEKKNVLGIPVTRQTTEQVTQLNILSYELSMPLVFVKGKFNASVTPSYVIPMNKVQGERGKEMFYMTLGVGVRL